MARRFSAFYWKFFFLHSRFRSDELSTNPQECLPPPHPLSRVAPPPDVRKDSKISFHYPTSFCFLHTRMHPDTNHPMSRAEFFFRTRKVGGFLYLSGRRRTTFWRATGCGIVDESQSSGLLN